MINTSLLALSGLRRAERPGSLAAATSVDNMGQLIRLRWIAVIGQLLTILAVRYGMNVAVPTDALLAMVALLAAGNLLAQRLLRHRKRMTNVEFLLALLFDVAVLTVQLYLTGGAKNPFAALFLLQVVLGSILLRGGLIWVLAPIAIGCYAFLAVRYRPLMFPPGLRDHVDELLAVGNWLGFALVALLLVPFIARISRNLRLRDAYLAELRQHAAEEDNLVRMGLFASGAAHELGTPLASLSVILGDWRHMPRLAGDAELMGELEEMQAEVSRCKSIVTDILHSAGQTRSEVLSMVNAAAFVAEISEVWRSTRSSNQFDGPTDVATGPLAGASILAEPALKQAVWNLLENAAEASPHWIRLRATREDGLMALSVRDDGPGFPAHVLEQLGQPSRSRKGAGHGIGLFLVATVARRLGGRLEAVNLPEGGAEVRLHVPLADGHGSGKA